MMTTPVPHMLTKHRPPWLLVWLAAISFLLSLVSPMLTLAAPPAENPPPSEADTITSDRASQPECPEGQVSNGNGGCIPDQQSPGCEAGLILDEATGACVEGTVPLQRETEVPTEPTTAPEPCRAGLVFNPDTGGCDPVPPTEVPADPTEVVEPTRAPEEPTETIAPTETTETTGTAEPTSAPAEPGAILQVSTWVCPAGLDPTETSAEKLTASCVEPLPGVGIALTSNDSPFTRDATDDRGQLQIADIPPGELTMNQIPPDGYAFGAITTSIFPDGPGGKPLPPTIGIEPDGQWAGSLDPGVLADIDIFYSWLDISITTETYWCNLHPSNGQHQYVETLDDSCQMTGPAVSMDLSALSPTATTGWPPVTVPGTSGAVTSWSGLSVPDGPYVVAETGFDITVWTPEVRCREQGTLTLPSDAYVSQALTYSAAGHELQLTPHVGLDWECKWYHFAANIIYVFNYQCANAPSNASSSLDVRMTCNASAGLNEGFTLVTPYGTEHRVTFQSSKVDSGLASFGALPEGNFTLAKDPVPGFGQHAVFCDKSNWLIGGPILDEPWAKLTPGSQGSIPLTIDPSNTYDQTIIHCVWYSIPGTPPSLPGPSGTIELPETKPPLFIPICDPEEPILQQGEPVEACIPDSEIMPEPVTSMHSFQQREHRRARPAG